MQLTVSRAQLSGRAILLDSLRCVHAELASVMLDLQSNQATSAWRTAFFDRGRKESMKLESDVADADARQNDHPT